MLLEFEGYSVLEAENGVVAVQLAKRKHPLSLSAPIIWPMLKICVRKLSYEEDLVLG